MNYCTVGRSGLRVSRLTLGAMTFGSGNGIWESIAGLDRNQAARLVRLALDRDINLIDTADAYSQGQSEEVVGQVLALASRRRVGSRRRGGQERESEGDSA